jgi:predicted transcriptional regulator
MAKKLSPQEVMRNLTIGYWVARLVHVAAKLKLADLMKKGPRTIEDLTAAANVQPQALYRILRALASVGVFAETKNGRFKLTPLAATLQTGAPTSMHAWALMINENWGWDAWKELLHGVKTGEVPFSKAHGVPLFEYFEQHTEDLQVFEKAKKGSGVFSWPNRHYDSSIPLTVMSGLVLNSSLMLRCSPA